METLISVYLPLDLWFKILITRMRHPEFWQLTVAISIINIQPGYLDFPRDIERLHKSMYVNRIHH